MESRPYRWRIVMAFVLALGLLAPCAPSPSALAEPTSQSWTRDSSFTIDYLGRNATDGVDRYQVTAGWGATFFAIATESIPLLPAEQSVQIVTDGYRAAFPGKRLEDLQPGDSFEFQVPLGTVVATQWRQSGSVTEFWSLRGDRLLLDTNPRAPVVYRLMRVENPTKAEVRINQNVSLKPYDLAQDLFSQGDPSFKPDFLQVKQASDAIEGNATTVTIDLSKKYLDDFRQIRESGELRGKTPEGLDIYWFRSGDLANPLFRVDDGVGDSTDLSSLPSPLRVYYYKDGTVRTFQRAADVAFLSGRQPDSESWAQVYAEYGQMASPPTRWEIGQPEQDGAARELNKLGVVVLRFDPKRPPRGNFFTNLLDQLMALMKRKQS